MPLQPEGRIVSSFCDDVAKGRATIGRLEVLLSREGAILSKANPDGCWISAKAKCGHAGVVAPSSGLSLPSHVTVVSSGTTPRVMDGSPNVIR